MIERKGFLAAVGMAVLLTGCGYDAENPRCPTNSNEVAKRNGGNPNEWRTLKDSELWEYKGSSRSFTGPKIGKLLVDISDGVPEVLLPGQEATAESAVFRCNRYDEQNPPESYKQSFEAIQQPPKILPEN